MKRPLISLALLAVIGQTAVYAKSITVTIEGFEYKPKKVTVSKGDEVTFINKDSAPHTVTPEKESHFQEVSRLLKNQQATVKFDEAGDQKYYCAIHPSMKGEVVVK
ncbi:MAG TPA: cupredoxin family copper-binding protein [Candidatus Obscuribacterales bacterium]